MTEETLDPDDARDVLHDIDAEAEEAIAALRRGPPTGEIRNSLDNIEQSAQELARHAESVQNAVGNLAGGSYSEGITDLGEGASDAYDHAQAIREMVAVAEEALDAEDAVNGTLDIGGVTFEMTMAPVDGPDAEVSPDSFGEWLGGVMDENDLDRDDIVEMSVAGEGHVDAILDSDVPLAEMDEPVTASAAEEACTSILKGLHTHGHIAKAERRKILRNFGWTDSDVGVTESGSDEYTYGEAIAKLLD